MNTIPNTPIRYLVSMLRPDIPKLVLAALVAGSAQLLEIFFAVYFGYLIDVLSNSKEVTTYLIIIVTLYPALVFVQSLLWRIGGFIMMYIESGLKMRINLHLFGYLSGHGMEYFSNRFAGSVSGKVSSVSNGASSVVDQFIWNYWGLALSLIGSIGYALWVDWKIASIIVVAMVIVIPTNVYFARRKTVLSERAEELRVKLRGSIVDTITNIAAVIHYAHRKGEYDRTEALTLDSYRADIKSSFYTNITILGNAIGLFVFSIGVLSLALYLLSMGEITTGTLVGLLMIMSHLLWQLSWVGQQMNYFAQSYGEMQNGLKDIVVPHAIDDSPDAKVLEVKKGMINFDQVTFGYGDNVVFKDFSLTIKAGERVGLVGPSGSGKTTFVSLLLRNQDVGEGAIKIDGSDIRTVTQDSLHEAIAVVPQDPSLFHRSIRDNIAYGKLSATDVEVEEAAAKAQAHDFIVATKDGYKTLVGERGVKLSGGQRQRVAIARAILKAAPILILDEATSSLDSESESEIQKALHALMEGKTVIAVAHRLSTIREMDRILVLEGGKVVEDGSHDELLKITDGLYARLWTHQAGGFMAE